MRRQELLTAVVAGMLTFGLTAHLRADDQKSEGTGSTKEIECQGGNECKAKGDCGGPGYSCAGNNACKGKGWVTVKSQAECDKLMAKVKASGKKSGKSAKKKG